MATPPAHDPDATIPDGPAATPADPDATIPEGALAAPADSDATISDGALAASPPAAVRPQTFADMPAPGTFRGVLDTSGGAPPPDDDATMVESPTHADSTQAPLADMTILEPGTSHESVPADDDMTMLPEDQQPSSVSGLPSATSASRSSSSLSHSVSAFDQTRLPSVRATQRLDGGSPESKLFAGRYEIERELARGGMGVVYKARHVDLNKVVAIKVMLSGMHASPTARRRFLFEAEASAKLQHPHILPVTDIGEEGENLYFTMQFVDGADLKDRQKDMARDKFLDVMVKVADGVGYAHQRGIIHRDLKPANVMIDEQGEPLIMDFGLAKQLEDAESGAISQSQTMEGTIFGTPHYMPPEQASGEISEVDVRSDVWALGVMLYAFYTGKLPFEGNSTAELLNKILTKEPPAPRQLDPSIDQDLEAIILKAMEKDKSRRYASAVQLRDDLQRLQDGLPVEARRATVGYRLSKWARRNRGALAIAAVLVLAAIGVTGVAIQRHLAGISADLGVAASDQAAYADQFLEHSQRFAALAAGDDGDEDRAAAVSGTLATLDQLEGRVDALLVRLDDLVQAPLQSQRARANAIQKETRDVSLALSRTQERVQGLLRAREELVQAAALLQGSVPELEASAVAALDSSVALDPDAPLTVADDAAPAARLRAHTEHHARLLRELREQAAPTPSGDAGDALTALESQLTSVTGAAFTAHNLAGTGTPEAQEAETLIAAAQAVRARVEAARDRATRRAQASQLAAHTQSLLQVFEATAFNKDTRLPRLAAAGTAQALVQRALEALPGGSPALERARLGADIAYAIALLDTKSFSAFDEFVAREGRFTDDRRARLEEAKGTRLEELKTLRERLLGGSAKISIQGGSGVELGGTSRPELQLVANKGKLRQLEKLADHPLMDDELESLRQDAIADAQEALALAERKVAQKQVGKAVDGVRERTAALSPADRAEQVNVLAKAWDDALATLDRKAEHLEAGEAAALRKAIVTGRAALYRDAATTLADSAPARARTLARLAMEAIEAIHTSGQAPQELVDAYRERLSSLLD